MRNHCNSCGSPECTIGERIAELEAENAALREAAQAVVETHVDMGDRCWVRSAEFFSLEALLEQESNDE